MKLFNNFFGYVIALIVTSTAVCILIFLAAKAIYDLLQ